MNAHHVLWCLLLAALSAPFGVRADQGQPTSLRLANGVSITNIKTTATEATEESSTFDYPRPPIAGFSPLVTIAISDQRSSIDLDMEHRLHYDNLGSLQYPPPDDQFAVGLLDSGSVVNLVADPSTYVLGLTGDRLTENVFDIGGTGGQLTTIVSYPIGVFANGLGVINPGGLLDIDQLVGHSNASVLASPEISCDNGETVTAIIGTPFLSFFTTTIRASMLHTITLDGRQYFSPDVDISSPFEPSNTDYPHRIGMEPAIAGGLPPLTAAYLIYPDDIDDDAPDYPTMLTMAPMIPSSGGTFFANMGVLEGEPGPLNPLREIRVLVDTGAQSSIISTSVADSLNLPLTPDFTVDICGIGGLTTDVPGYYIDYIQINAGGGELQFSNAPFIVLDLQSSEGTLEGILGMNFFWNRDIVFNPDLLGSSSLHVAAPLDLPFGDFDRDSDVDMSDFGTFQLCLSGPDIPQLNPLCILADADGDEDIDQDDFGVFQLCLSGPNVPADPACDP